MIIGCGRYRILCFSRCTLADQVKSCISFACALKGLPSGQQALTLTLTHFLIWVLERVCYGQHGEIVGDFGQTDQFPIRGGVRQGCVLTPRKVERFF